MMSEINYLHNEGCQNKRLNMNCHSQKKAKGMTKMIDGVFIISFSLFKSRFAILTSPTPDN